MYHDKTNFKVGSMEIQTTKIYTVRNSRAPIVELAKDIHTGCIMYSIEVDPRATFLEEKDNQRTIVAYQVGNTSNIIPATIGKVKRVEIRGQIQSYAGLYTLLMKYNQLQEVCIVVPINNVRLSDPIKFYGLPNIPTVTTLNITTDIKAYFRCNEQAANDLMNLYMALISIGGKFPNLNTVKIHLPIDEEFVIVRALAELLLESKNELRNAKVAISFAQSTVTVNFPGVELSDAATDPIDIPVPTPTPPPSVGRSKTLPLFVKAGSSKGK